MSRYTIRVARFDPEKDKAPRSQDYQVEAEQDRTVLDALNMIKWEQDGTLAYRRSCRHGICGSCAMTINGVNRLACETTLASLGTSTIAVEPLRSFPVEKDLIVTMEGFYDQLGRVMPYLITKGAAPSDQERRQTQDDRKKLDGLYECILCASCTSSCPSVWADPDYLGPAALVKAARFVQDTRDEGRRERLEVVDDKHGVWRCHTIFNCQEACPKGLNPTEAIVGLRREVAKGRF